VPEVEEDDKCIMRKLETCEKVKEKEVEEDQWMRKLIMTCVDVK
jgi:hypothetical protein